MNALSTIAKPLLLTGCAMIALGIGAGSGFAQSPDCPAASATQSVRPVSADHVTVLERVSGYAPSQVVFNPANRNSLLVVEDNGQIHLLDISQSAAISTQVITSNVPANIAAFSPDGQRIAVGLADGTVRVIAVGGDGEPRVLKGPHGRVIALAFSPDGSKLAAEGLDGEIHLWSGTGSMQEIVLYGAPETRVISFSRDGSEIGAGTYNGLFVFSTDNTADNAAMQTLSGHRGPILDVTFDGQKQGLRSAGADGTVRRWALSSNILGECEFDEGANITAMSFSQDGTRVAVGFLNGTVLISRVGGDMQESRGLHVFKDPIRSMAFSPNDDALAIGSLDGTVRLWRLSP